jgi:hypothetical protein
LREFLREEKALIVDVRKPSITTWQSKLFKILKQSFSGVVKRKLNIFISNSPSDPSYFRLKVLKH